MSVSGHSNSQFSKIQEAGYLTTKHVHKSGNIQANILKDLNKRAHDGRRGIKVLVKGETTDQFNKALVAILKQKDWQVAFLSALDEDPKQALGIVLNKNVFINTLDAKKLAEEGFDVLRVRPPVVIPENNGEDDEDIVTAPSIKPILVFIGVAVLIILIAWAVWRVSQ